MPLSHGVDEMGLLFSAVHLLLEAIDQTAAGGSSKARCLDYFVKLYLEKEIKPSPSHYLEMIKAIFL
jgi:hypothetical protein